MKPMHGLWVLALIAGCAAGNGDNETLQRLTRIEQRLDAQDKAIAELRADTNPLAQQIKELNTKLDTLIEQTKKPVRQARREPDANTVYSVPLGPSPAFGPPTAKVTMVMALDYDCPYCRRAFGTVDELRKKYGNDLRVVYKSLVVHPRTAMAAAKAACAAHHQGKWRALTDLIWTKAYDVKGTDPNAMSPEHMAELAKQAKLDMKRYQQDVESACLADIADDMKLLQKLGANATPTFFINGRYVAGALPIERFSSLIDEELAKANAAVAGGVSADRYYEQEIVAKGQTEIAPP